MSQSLLEKISATQANGGGQSQAIYDPATGELIANAPQHTLSDLEEVLRRAAEAQPEWAASGHEERSRILHRAADAIDAHAEELAVLLSREQGKPLNGPNARFEVGACAAWLRANADFPTPGKVLVDDGETYAEMHYEPLGVVAAIGPWNWPMMISVWQLAAALRMGNTVVLKPSEYTPLSVLALVEVLNTEIPEGVLGIVCGDGQLGKALSEHPAVNKIMFTGSINTGRSIMAAAAQHLNPITLELGGNDPGIILDDVDPVAIAEGLFWGAFINTGQTCAALKRLYVPDELYEAVCESLVDIASQMPMGNGLDEANVLGPLQNKAQFEVVKNLVDQARDAGAKILLGGNPDDSQPGFFYPTTLVADIDPHAPLVVEEQFGPALPIVRYHDLEQAITWANELETGLGASVWSADRERAREVASRIQAGTVWINAHGAVDPRIPFGGIKSSGMGMEFGIEGLKNVAAPKVVNG